MSKSKDQTSGITKYKSIEIPCECKKDCDDNKKRIYGCGYEENYRGKSTLLRSDGSKTEEDLTCPQFFGANEFIISVEQYLEDYKRGNLGPIWNLPNLLYESLLVLESETAKWSNYQNENKD